MGRVDRGFSIKRFVDGFCLLLDRILDGKNPHGHVGDHIAGVVPHDQRNLLGSIERGEGALAGILLEQLLDELSQAAGEFLVEGLLRDAGLLDSLKGVAKAGAAENVWPHEHFARDNADGEQVRSGGCLFANGLFGAHVGNGSENGSRLR